MAADDHELCISRFIAASPDTVWDVLVNRQEEWWCPQPWRVTIDEQDRRAGGRCAMTMHGPAGEIVPSDGIYLAWDEGRRFATTDAITGNLEPAQPFMIGIWEIAPETANGVSGTRYTASARHWNDDDRRQHVEMGFVEGWSICADQLAALCESG